MPTVNFLSAVWAEVGGQDLEGFMGVGLDQFEYILVLHSMGLLGWVY